MRHLWHKKARRYIFSLEIKPHTQVSNVSFAVSFPSAPVSFRTCNCHFLSANHLDLASSDDGGSCSDIDFFPWIRRWTLSAASFSVQARLPAFLRAGLLHDGKRPVGWNRRAVQKDEPLSYSTPMFLPLQMPGPTPWWEWDLVFFITEFQYDEIMNWRTTVLDLVWHHHPL